MTVSRSRYGPWAVVTGASDGIGRAIALRLAEAGIDLVLVARRAPLLHALADQLATDHQIETTVIEADLSKVDAIQRVAEATEDLDVGLLVACAGFGTSGQFIEADLARELELVDVNCRAVAAMGHLFGRRLAARGHGGLVLMSSVLAFQGVPGAANYAASKAYIQSLAEGLSAELGPLGVDVVASAPGPVHSGFADRADMHLAMGLEPDAVAAGTLAALGRRTNARPGWLSKLLAASMAPAPRRLRVRILARVMRGFIAHQAA